MMLAQHQLHWLAQRGSEASCIMRQAPCVRHTASCVMTHDAANASCIVRQVICMHRIAHCIVMRTEIEGGQFT